MSQPRPQVSVPAAGLDSRIGQFATRAWRLAGAIVVLLMAVFWLYRPSSASLMQIWDDADRTSYTHGYVIAALVLYLVLRRRDRLADLPWSPSVLAAVLMAVASVAWVVAVRSGIEIVHQLLLLGLLGLSVWAVFGWRISLSMALPIGYLVFAVPVWDAVNSSLQSGTVVAVSLLLKLSSIPAFIEGNFVHLAVGVFEIAGGCSGLHYFIVSLAIATLYGEICDDNLKVRVTLVALAALLAMVTNWLRVYIVIVAGYLTDMQHYLVRVEHIKLGWALFAVLMTVFFFLARRFVPAAQPESPSVVSTEKSTRGAPLAVGLIVASIAVVVAPIWELKNPVEPATLSAKVLLPRPASGWSEVALDASNWNPVFRGADQTVRGEFAAPDDRRVQAYVASYELQHQDKELVAFGNSLIGPDEGAIVSTASVQGPGAVKELTVAGPRERSMIRYYYLIGALRTDRGITAQLWYGLHAIKGATPSSVIALRTPCRPDCDAARALLNEFMASNASPDPHQT